MILIRRSVFETNSSSTHSICITKNKPEEIPTMCRFGLGEYGWEYRRLDGQEKANYLYTAIMCQNDHESLKQQLFEILSDLGIVCEFDEPKYDEYGYPEGFYIDHSYEIRPVVMAILHSKNRLLKYLFSDESFVLTGNDNGDCDVSIQASYPHEEYYKGN